MKDDWYVLIERATEMVDSGRQSADAISILESIVKKEPLRVEGSARDEQGRERELDNPKHFLPRLILTRLHMQRSELHARMDEEDESDEEKDLAAKQFEFMHENAKNPNIIDYSNAGLEFLDGNHDQARQYYERCRRPTNKEGWIRTALSKKTRGYLLYAWNKRQMSRDEEEKAWTKLREEIFDQTEVQLKRLMRGSQKMAAIAKSHSIDYLAIGIIVGGLGTGLYIATPSLDEITAEATPAVMEQVEKAAEEDVVLTPKARWYRKGRHVILDLKYSNGKEIPATEVMRLIYKKKERGKRERTTDPFIPTDDGRDFKLKITGRRPIRYKAVIELEGHGIIETEYLWVR